MLTMGAAATLAPVLCFVLVVVTTMDPLPSAVGVAPIPGTSGGLRTGSVPARYATLVVQAGSLCAAAPPAIIAAQINQESGWNPTAVSPAGAEGISQFLPSTWAAVASAGTSPFDANVAIPTQGKYDCAIAAEFAPRLRSGQLHGPDLTSLMLAGYNAGPAAVIRAGGIPPFAQTQNYVRNIVASAATCAGATGTGSGPAQPILAPPGSFAAREIAAAMRWLGTPYAWAGGSDTGPTRVCAGAAAEHDCQVIGFDCSGLVLYAVYQASRGTIRLPHFADTQTRMGTPVARSALAPGDVISFTFPGERVAHHVGIYLGNDQMIDAPDRGSVIRIDTLDSAYYTSQTWRAARYG
jgi:cell wall-associated NlpC family hydrolase